MIYFIITFFTGVITGALIEAAVSIVIERKKTKIAPDDRQYVLHEIIERTNLQMYEATTAISKGREAVDMPEIVYNIAKDRIVRQFAKMIDDHIICEDDPERHCFIFRLHFWLKEAEK